MNAIWPSLAITLAIQALVFQDGGLLALGANVFGIFGEAKDKIAENEIRSMVDQVQLYREGPNDKVVVFLDPAEFKSTWLGNKAVYRTRMAMADKGELLVLAPGLKEFGGTVRHSGDYGSDEIEMQPVKITSATVGADGLSVRLRAEGLRELKAALAVRVPEPLAHGCAEDAAWLLLEILTDEGVGTMIKSK